MKLTVKLAGAVIAMAAAASSVPAAAAPTYTGFYVLGDSLSDTGNVAAALRRNLPTPPFYLNSFTNGPVAVEVLGQRLGFNANPSYFTAGTFDASTLQRPQGNNYAVAGSTAGLTGGVPGANLPNQIGALIALSGGALDPNALYTVFTGGNDVRSAANSGMQSTATTGVATEIGGINFLYANGARNFLVVNVPDISLIPEYLLTKTAQQRADARTFTNNYNTALAAGLAASSSLRPGADVKLFDLYNYGLNALANPGQFGITNTTQPCYEAYPGVDNDNPPVINAACGMLDPTTKQPSNIDSFFYWDKIHPTAKVHAALGNALYAAVALPEPGTWAMMIAGFGIAGSAMRRQRRRVTVRYA